MNRSEETAVYKIHIQGHLDSHRTRHFEGMQITLLPEGITQLIGPVLDQSALYGLLSRIRDLGVPLLLVQRLDPADEEKL
ncbi:MAG: hypothetical protein CL608_11915 [Anaerolineaceae bacterium]|nr:hypothetical protein [Anaerolineaceae bacterium]